MAGGMVTRGAMVHGLNTARTVVPLTEGHDELLAEIGVLLDRMADDVHGDHETRERWSRLLISLVHLDSDFAASRLGFDLLAVAVAYGAPSFEAHSN